METWCLVFDKWEKEEEVLRETLLTLGNGYFATRGASEESQADNYHYPGSYLGGGYNRLETQIEQRNVINEDLVNWPNWLCLNFRFQNEDWFDLDRVEILSYHQKLEMKKGQLTRLVHFKDQKGRETILKSRRIVSMDNAHVGAISWSLEAINWSGIIEVQSSIDGSIKNSGVKRYQGLKNKHLCNIKKSWPSSNVFIFESSTSQSQISLAQAIRTDIFINNQYIKFPSKKMEDVDKAGLSIEIKIEIGDKLRIEKIMTLFTSKDYSCSNPRYEAKRLLDRLPRFNELLKGHYRQWERLWGLCDIELSGKIRETRLLRLHIFHLLQTVSLNSLDLDVGAPARGLHGEAYRGHIFWDELFILPFLNLRIPVISRSLLLYRYRRLDEAKINARNNGFEGAMFPWQSGSNGEEESQVVHINPISERWIPDSTHRQRHINAAILYNIWQYYETTADKDFLSFFGMEMAIEISRFWISAMTYNNHKKRYELVGVVGPDEFHTHYPDSEDPGIDNNAYTNFMISWCIRTTIKIFSILTEDRQREILKFMDLSKHELERWQKISQNVYLPLNVDGILDQFEGFNDLMDLDWDAYKKKYGNIQRIDRILESEGDNVNRYKVNKQADVLMLYYLFSPEELKSGFEWMGYPFEKKWIRKNIDYHLNLSSNGSTLSRIVHAWVVSKYDNDRAWEWFNRALETDVADIQGGTTFEGIHLGAMSGTVDLVQRCFTGIEVEEDVLWIRPMFPTELDRIQLLIHFRGHSLALMIDRNKLRIKVKRSWLQLGKLGVQGRIYDLKQGDEFDFDLRPDGPLVY